MASAVASGQSPYLVPMNGTADRPKPLRARHTPTIGQSDLSQIVALISRPTLPLPYVALPHWGSSGIKVNQRARMGHLTRANRMSIRGLGELPWINSRLWKA